MSRAEPMRGAAPIPPVSCDLTVVIVSHNDAGWLPACLRSLRHGLDGIDHEVVVVDNGSDGAAALMRRHFAWVRAIECENRGFGHANNAGCAAGVGRYVLFLNPDTELIGGSPAQLLAALDADPRIGAAGARQVTADGTLWPTIRYFPGVRRALGDGLGLERWPGRPRWAGERELDMRRYGQATECDWTSGSFLLVRREALIAAGGFDERFFLFSEEPDLCLRIKQAGFAVWHLPLVTVLHHAGKGGVRPRMVAQDAFSRAQYAAKHFAPSRRAAYLGVIGAGHALRLMRATAEGQAESRRAARLALRTLAGRGRPPFGDPPPTAIMPPAAITSAPAPARPVATAQRPDAPAQQPIGAPLSSHTTSDQTCPGSGGQNAILAAP